MTCKFDKKLKDYDWDIDPELFICVEPVGFVIGGIAKDYSYLNEVEILAPGLDCTIPIGSKLDPMTGKELTNDITDYPHEIIGASAGYMLGQNIVCGGAIMDYTDCSIYEVEGGAKLVILASMLLDFGLKTIE